MHDPADDRCPRCDQPFHCGMHDAGPCPCSTLKLSPATLAQLKLHYTGCLCLRCLAELATAEAAEPAQPATRR